jgi:hypothetical protein
MKTVNEGAVRVGTATGREARGVVVGLAGIVRSAGAGLRAAKEAKVGAARPQVLTLATSLALHHDRGRSRLFAREAAVSRRIG